MSAETVMKQFTGAQKGGGDAVYIKRSDGRIYEEVDGYTPKTGESSSTKEEFDAQSTGGRRRRNTKNSWLSHVKATMKMHRGKSFKQVLKLAKKSYKKSQSSSQSHSGGRRRKSKVSKNRRQRGGSSVAEYAGAYP